MAPRFKVDPRDVSPAAAARRHRASVTQAKITRCLMAARDAGIMVTRYEIKPDGTISVYSTDPEPEGELDRELREFEARHG